MEISLEAIFGVIVGIFVPSLLWAWSVSASQKKTLTNLKDLTLMHLDEDSVFSTKKTNQLLEEYIRQGESMHRDTLDVLQALNRTISELTYYIRWSTSQQLGKEAPPYVEPTTSVRG